MFLLLLSKRHLEYFNGIEKRTRVGKAHAITKSSHSMRSETKGSRGGLIAGLESIAPRRLIIAERNSKNSIS